MPALDYNTAIKGIREANEDFIQLLSKLRDFLTTNKELTFTIGDETVVVDGLLELIDNYRNGKYQSVIIGTDADAVMLSIDGDGNLKVSDVNGNLVGVVCSELSFSDISDTTIDSATIRECNIENVSGSVKVSGGTVTLESINVGTFEAQSIVAQKNLSGYAASIEASYARNLYIQGDRRMAFPVQRNVFYEGGFAIDSFASKMASGYSNDVWTWSSSTAKPSMLGLQQGDRGEIPSLITICGNNKYSDFLNQLGQPNGLKNLTAFAFVDNTPAKADVPMTVDDSNMASVFVWPYAEYALSSQYYQFAERLVVSEFGEDDIGKEVYYRTGASAWTIYRTLTINYNNLAPISATLGSPYEIPPYSCVRFIVGRTGTATGGSTISILEIA